jgi:hypothetical protein
MIFEIDEALDSFQLNFDSEYFPKVQSVFRMRFCQSSELEGVIVQKTFED